jgi:di/tricarboxylate transporter
VTAVILLLAAALLLTASRVIPADLAALLPRVYGPGNYRISDYVRMGTPLNLLIWVLSSLLGPIFWPLGAPGR